MRVVERLSSAEGSPGAFALVEIRRRHCSMLTISMLNRRSGQAFTQAGACLASSRSVAHVAFAHHAAFGIVLRHAVGAVPGAVLAADAGVGAVQHDAGDGVLGVRVDRTTVRQEGSRQ